MQDEGADQINVLVIDDEEGVRRLLAEVIGRQEHQVVAVSSAEEALALLPFWTFQVAFIDHRLPGMDGLVLAEYLRRSNPDMAIAMISGAVDGRVERKSRDLSIRFIPKPFGIDEVLQVIDEYLSEARARDDYRRSVEVDVEPPIARFIDDVGASFGVPSVPARLEERLVSTIKRCLNDMRSASRYNERDRVVALCGLITAKVLNVDLPRMADGRTLFEEYDTLMESRGKRVEFRLR